SGPRSQRIYPQRRLTTVGIEIEITNYISYTADDGANLRIPDLIQGEQIVDGERPLGRRRLGDGAGGDGQEQEHDACVRHGRHLQRASGGRLGTLPKRTASGGS